MRLPDEVTVVNVGLPLFADAVRGRASRCNVDWRIPAGGDPDVVAALERLYGERAAVDRPAPTPRSCDGSTTVSRSSSGSARARARAGLAGRMLLHCGPAIDWPDVCDPLRRSMRAAVVAEGWADDVDEADRLLADGAVRLEPAYRHDACCPWPARWARRPGVGRREPGGRDPGVRPA